MKNLFAILIFFYSAQSITVFGQDFVLPLYNGQIPNSKPVGSINAIPARGVQNPDIAVYLPANSIAPVQAVIICPGGSYKWLSYDKEGTEIARNLNLIGVAGIVLKYRLPTNVDCTDPHKTPLIDAQRAMRMVRFNASKWKIDPTKIGIMGFSAGGHLASTLGTHFDYGNKTSVDSIEQQSCRPDFMILIYPVISFIDSCTHKGSREALLGKEPSKDLVAYFSNELQVKSDTPPVFFVHSDDDSSVPVENTLLMYAALRSGKIPAELHILSEGEHGFGLKVGNEHVASWFNSLRLWLNSLK